MFSLLVSKIKSILLLIFQIFRWCVCWRRRNMTELDEKLSQECNNLGEEDCEHWDEWENVPDVVVERKESVAERKIKAYRNSLMAANEKDFTEEDSSADLFGDMEPKINLQTKIYIGPDLKEDRLAAKEGVCHGEEEVLGAWMEGGKEWIQGDGWEVKDV